MKNSITLATSVALFALVSGAITHPASAFDFNSILQNLSRGVSGWTDLDARENEISSQISAAANAGQLTAAEADGFRVEMTRVQQVEAQIKASGRQLGATDSFSFTNSLNNLTNRINLAITSKTTANAASLTAVETLRAQLNKAVDDARAAHTMTRLDAEMIKRDLSHNANIQSAFAGSDGTVSAKQALVLSDDLARIQLDINQHITTAQAGAPQLSAQRTAIEQKIAAGVSGRTITDNQAANFRRELQRISTMETNFMGYDGVLSANEQLAVSTDLDRLSSRIEYQISFDNNNGYGNERDSDNGWHGGEDHRNGNGWNKEGRNRSALKDIDERRANLTVRLNAAQNARKLPRWQISRFRTELDRIASTEAHVKSQGGGRATFSEMTTLSSDLTKLEQSFTAQLAAGTSRAARYHGQY